MSRCVRVPKSEGEQVRKALMDGGILDHRHRIGADGDFLLIPILADSYEGYEVVDFELGEQPRQETDYKAVAKVPDDIRAMLPSAFDVIGDIAIMKLEDGLKPYSGEIGRALVQVTPNIRAVFDDAGVKGEFRVRELVKIYGEGSSEVIHKENGVRMMTDPSKVYFNPRLATERMRIARMVRPGETITDMFAGVAPFGCVICRNADPGIVYSIDLNPECERFMRENMRLNRITKIEPIIGDGREVVKTLPKADRVLMNLPQIADEFLQDALGCVKSGGMVHMHKILERSELEGYKEQITSKMSDLGLLMEIAHVEELKNYSPTKSVYVFDIRSA
ncbi:putative methyltransferase [Thermoplasmatales archaeon BRNA1]|nr:putative methyltransferase [Thermoplasmatales archaeon BRNA1]